MNTETVLIFIGGSLLMLFLVVFIFVFAFIFKKKQFTYLREKAALKAQYEQEILTSQIEVQNATLQHVSEEIHDNVGQLLSVARINLNIVEESGPDDDNREFIKQANELVKQSISDLRALTKSLDGDFVQDFGLIESIAQELQRIRQTRIFGTELNVIGTAYSLGFQREIVLYRVVQEVLQNAIKHAEATQLSIQLVYTPELFTLSIVDDGKGFTVEDVKINGMSQSGAGLRNVQRRVKLIGGACDFVSSVGQGTRVVITLPNQTV